MVKKLSLSQKGLKELRIYLEKDQIQLNIRQITNLFWFKDGYLYYYPETLQGDLVARAWSFLAQDYPMREVEITTMDFQNLEEAFYVDRDDLLPLIEQKIISVYQIGIFPVGRGRLIAKKLARDCVN